MRGGHRARALGAVQGAPAARGLPRGRGAQAQHGQVRPQGPQGDERGRGRRHHHRPQAHRALRHARHLLLVGGNGTGRGQRRDGHHQLEHHERQLPQPAVARLLLVRESPPKDVYCDLDGQGREQGRCAGGVPEALQGQQRGQQGRVRGRLLPVSGRRQERRHARRRLLNGGYTPTC